MHIYKTGSQSANEHKIGKPEEKRASAAKRRFALFWREISSTMWVGTHARAEAVVLQLNKTFALINYHTSTTLAVVVSAPPTATLSND